MLHRLLQSPSYGRLLDSAPTASHQAFFDEITRRARLAQPWEELACGLVALRLLEAWADGEPIGEWGHDAVALRIADLGADLTTREPLVRLVNAMHGADSRDFALVAPILSDYARALEFDAEWQLAVDAYRALIRRLRGSRSPLVSKSYIRLGMCYRHLNCLGMAGAAYRRARAIAVRRGDTGNELLARMGKARLAVLRGNLPAAELIARRVLRRARKAGLQNAWFRALHDLGDVAFRRNQYSRAARLYFRALSLCNEDTERDRILADLAHVFVRLQAFDTARDAYLVIASCSKEQWVRWAAHVNLLDIAAYTGDRTTFDRYADGLDRANLTPELSVWHQLTLGEGLLRFHEPARARDHLQRALAMASEFGFNEALIETDRLLATLNASLPAPASQLVSDELSEIASTLRRLRVSSSL